MSRQWIRVNGTLVIAGLLLGCCLPGSAVAGEPSPVRFIDAAGQTLVLAGTPQRLVVVGDGPYMLAHLLYAFAEGRSRLVGMEKKGRRASDFLPHIDPSFSSRSFLDPNPGPEQIAGLHPDLVLCRGRERDARAEALAEIGIPTAFLGLESPARYLEDLALLGTILGNPQRAEEIATYYRSRLAVVEQALAPVPEKERPRVLLALAMPRGGTIAVQVPARGWLQTMMVEAAGGKPVWLGSAEPMAGWTVVTIEQIARWNPDRIYLVFWHSLDPAQALADLRTDRHWAALAAVKAGQLRAFPADLYGWDTPDPRWLLGLLWTARATHPGRLADLDLDAEVERFYRELYGMDRAAVAAVIRPAVRAQLE